MDVSIIIPCLNEEESLPVCVPNAQAALKDLQQLGLEGEIVIADNGSTDNSIEIATQLGARVVNAPQRGYGAALISGLSQAKGKYLVMGDADASYNFQESVPMIQSLVEGADICMGSRFKGTIKEGAMPWKNRHIGNPILTGILNLFFKSGISDAHCGLRALTKTCFDELKLTSTGMEFASEMVVKACLLNKKMTEVPITLSPDVRSRAPHLRPWRDGWRHLIFLFLLSPLWLFLIPGITAVLLGLGILSASTLSILFPQLVTSFFGNTWSILAGGLILLGQQGCIFALASHLYGVSNGYRKKILVSSLLHKLTLEFFLISGTVLLLTGGAILLAVLGYWTSLGFEKIPMIAPQMIGIVLFAMGVQNIFGGFLLAIIGGNKSDFMRVDL